LFTFCNDEEEEKEKKKVLSLTIRSSKPLVSFLFGIISLLP